MYVCDWCYLCTYHILYINTIEKILFFLYIDFLSLYFSDIQKSNNGLNLLEEGDELTGGHFVELPGVLHLVELPVQVLDLLLQLQVLPEQQNVVKTSVWPELVFLAGCQISGRVIRHALPDNPAFSCRLPDIWPDNPALPDIRPNH